EGNFGPGSRVVVIEDVITSGGSALRAVNAVRDQGGEVLGVLAVVDREQEGRDRIEAAGVAVVVLETAGGLGLTARD
ncbi:MAG TPA: phosphoribosyltransferase family protein, partial [Microthrixaceae bacterium]|nr:phosphoribosyltransferase family protein [Microthrixaceae bacterium]